MRLDVIGLQHLLRYLVLRRVKCGIDFGCRQNLRSCVYYLKVV